jgi:hypothetical protein
MVRGFWSSEVAPIVGGAPFAYLAVEAASGPHVTPLLFAATADRLWFGIGRGTLKAHVIAKRPAVGVVVPGKHGSVGFRGSATLLDRLPVSPGDLVHAPFAFPLFAARNALEMTAFAWDVVRERALPEPLTPLSVQVERTEVLDGWPARAVLGWIAPDGPIALPATWDSRTRQARVPASLLKDAGGPQTAAACVCIDKSDGFGPLAKRGELLRGRGHAVLNGEVASVTVEVDRITRWNGFQTQTEPA